MQSQWCQLISPVERESVWLARLGVTVCTAMSCRLGIYRSIDLCEGLAWVNSTRSREAAMWADGRLYLARSDRSTRG